jgi:hypothetical protein
MMMQCDDGVWCSCNYIYVNTVYSLDAYSIIVYCGNVHVPTRLVVGVVRII